MSEILNVFINSSKTENYLSSDVTDSSRWAKRSLGSHVPLRLIKTSSGLVNSHIQSQNNYVEDDLFSLRFGDGDNTIQSKPLPHTKYLTLKQQRAKKKKNSTYTKIF